MCSSSVRAWERASCSGSRRSEWLVIDGCASRQDPELPAAGARACTGRRLHALVLTHPHLDHAQGLRPLPRRSWAGWLIGDLRDPRRVAALGGLDDNLVKAMNGSQTARSLSAIRDLWWTAQPTSRWALRSGEDRTIGEATVRVLHPRIPGAEAERRPSAVSSPMWIEWGGSSTPRLGLPRRKGGKRSTTEGQPHAAHHGLKECRTTALSRRSTRRSPRGTGRRASLDRDALQPGKETPSARGRARDGSLVEEPGRGPPDGGPRSL